ncbi:prefoldin subunit 2 [Onthophagus taurus]|uniref:prefoldin subunit 2 n=1 Tax=Onthophagus taurus TaxID=166361 RepID=UPI000C20B69D|nr:prefoldin subunit 2 [Onthophagus taurus]
MASDTKKDKKLRPEEILASFNQLRREQSVIGSKLDELEFDLNEHKLVIESLKTVDGGRKCFRLVGGILTERTVKEVLPEVEENKTKLEELSKIFHEHLIAKAHEIYDFKVKNNIRIHGPESLKDEVEPESSSAPKEARGNVLVS